MRVLIYTMIWMCSETIMPRERRQSQKTNSVRFHIYEMFRAGKYIETESRFLVARSWGGREIGNDF